MPLRLVRPYAAPMDHIECVEWMPVLSEKEAARLKLMLEIRRLDINGRSARLRPLVGETDQQELL